MIIPSHLHHIHHITVMFTPSSSSSAAAAAAASTASTSIGGGGGGMNGLVDVCDMRGVWREGEVIERRGKSGMKIHYLFSHHANDEEISADEIHLRIAPRGERAFIGFNHSYSSSTTKENHQRSNNNNEEDGGPDVDEHDHEEENGNNGNNSGLASKQAVDVWDEREECWTEGEIMDVRNDKISVRIMYDDGNGDYIDWMNWRIARMRIRPFGRETKRGHPDSKRIPGFGFGMNDYSHATHSAHSTNEIKFGDEEEDQVVMEEEKEGKEEEEEEMGVVASSSSSLPPTEMNKPRMIDAGKLMRYRSALIEKGLCVIGMKGDGNCLFRSVAHQMYGDDKLHGLVRSKCMEYMEEEREYFEPFVVKDGQMNVNMKGNMKGNMIAKRENDDDNDNDNEFERLIEMKKRDGEWGDDVDIQAMCELYNRPAEIYAFSHHHGAQMLRTFHEDVGDVDGNVENTTLSSLSSSLGTEQTSASSSSAAASSSSTTEDAAAQTLQSSSSVAAIITTRPKSKSPIRLSYYGGGHFDSIVTLDYLRSGGAEIIEEPGIFEDRRISQARAKKQIIGMKEEGEGAASAASSYHSVENGLSHSRMQYQHNQRNDLETALMESLKEAEEEENKIVETTMEKSFVEHVDPEARNAIEVTDIAATEQAAIEEAIRISRNEGAGAEVERASSTTTGILPNNVDVDVDIDMDAKQLEWAIMESVSGLTKNVEMNKMDVDTDKNNAISKNNEYEDDEEARLLQLAIAQSLEQEEEEQEKEE